MDDFKHIREIMLSSEFFCKMKRCLSWKRFQIHLQKYSNVSFSQFEETFRLRRFMLARDVHNVKRRQTTTWGGLSSLYWDLFIWSGYSLHLGPNENLICRQLYRRSKKSCNVRGICPSPPLQCTEILSQNQWKSNQQPESFGLSENKKLMEKYIFLPLLVIYRN